MVKLNICGIARRQQGIWVQETQLQKALSLMGYGTLGN